MKFLVDGMLGKLARWLRMMGYNVKYSDIAEDSHLLLLAKNKHRILLTRDLELYKRAIGKGVDAFYVEEGIAEQLAELAQHFGIRLKIDMTVSRCPKCNVTVKPIPKEKVRGRVRESTFSSWTEFWECRRCHQIYWQGAHWTQIKKTLKAADSQLGTLGKKEF